MIYKVLLFLSIVFSVAAQALLKYGAAHSEISLAKVSIWEKIASAFTPFFIVAAVFYGISFLAYSVVLSEMEINRAYPISVISAVVAILLISVIFFQEEISILRLAGIILSIVGVALIFYK